MQTYAKFNKHLADSGVIGMTAGAILGHLFEMRFINLNLSYVGWNKTNLLYTILRILITAIFIALFSTPHLLIKTDVEES